MLLLTGWLEVVTKVNVKAVINLTTVGGNITADEWLVFSAYVIDVGRNRHLPLPQHPVRSSRYRLDNPLYR